MNQCHKCGVELEEGIAICPLCGAELAGDGPANPAGQEDGAGTADTLGSDEEKVTTSAGAKSTDADYAEWRRARFWLWEMFTIVLVAVAIIVAASDFAYGFSLSWSAYPLTAVAFLWVFVSAVIWLARDIPIAYTAATLAVLSYLLVLDVLMPGRPWFASLALPITLLTAVIGGASAGLASALKFSVFQTLAAAVFSIGIFLIGLEIIFFFALDLESILSWSIIAFGGCFSISLLLLIINRRLRERHADFKRVFHL